MPRALTDALDTSTRHAPDPHAHPAAVRLAPVFDAERLRAELEILTGDSWRRQRAYSEAGASDEHPADWRVLALRSPGGDPARTDAGGPGPLPYRDTPWLERAPYFAEILASLPPGLRAARLMSLGVGASVETHRDTPLGFTKGTVRLHIPVTTNEGAVLVLDGEACRWQPGTFWYGDFSRPHSVANHGEYARVHLVLDHAVSPALFGLFPPGFAEEVGLANVLFERPEVPLGPVERATFACGFTVPADFRHWWGEALDETADGPGDTEAAVVPRPDGLYLTEAEAEADVGEGDVGEGDVGEGDGGRRDGPGIGLVHVGGGEFRLQGWTQERTLHLDRAARTVRFTVRDGSSRRTCEHPMTPKV